MEVNGLRRRIHSSLRREVSQDTDIADLLHKTQQIRQLTSVIHETVEAQTELLDDAHKELAHIQGGMEAMAAGIKEARRYIMAHPKRSICTMVLVMLALLYVILR
ncbi:hypothetical protein QR46_4254 [Giardia duodenalis assemblage B]|uniref:t-SNARE coiled-coil homology domain-containing protein n=1 Tax=Giardia duodenalis assemblage B TaxID=1394984 RepID=A0A132NPU3_GIAIN|nr:hypothetical protein QR46_4254 [Giardia intestinalis assemblage B]